MTSPKEKLKSMKKELLKDKELFDSISEEFSQAEEDRLLGPKTELEYKRLIKELKQKNSSEEKQDEK